MTTVHSSGGRDEVREMVLQLPGAAATRVLELVGAVILEKVKRAFVTKSRGGTDEAGGSWAPLKRGRRHRRKVGGRPSTGLSAAQRAAWWGEYRKGLAMYKGDKEHATRRAWVVLKASGVTITYLKSEPRILWDTGRLYDSLSFQVVGRAVELTANRSGAAAHHRGTNRLPQRRLWPDPNSWPASWWQDVLDKVRQELVNIATQQARDV